MGATRRLFPSGFVDLPGNRLDDFQSEHDAPAPELEAAVTPLPAPATLEAGTPLNELFVTVEAYPEEALYPAQLASRRAPEPSRASVVRLVVSFVRRVAAVLFAPVLLLVWLAQRTWWLIRLAFASMWRGVIGTVRAIGFAIAAIVSAVVTTLAAIAAAVRFVVHGTNNAFASARRRVTAAVASVVAFLLALVRGTWNGLVTYTSAFAAACLRFTRAAGRGVPKAVARGTALTAAWLAAGAKAVARLATVSTSAARTGVSAGAVAVVTTLNGMRRGLSHAAARGVSLARAQLVAGRGVAIAEGLRAASAWIHDWTGQAWASTRTHVVQLLRRAATASRVASNAGAGLRSIARQEAPVVRVSLVGIPAWARRATAGTTLAALATVAAGAAAGAILLIAAALRPAADAVRPPQAAAHVPAVIPLAEPVSTRRTENASARQTESAPRPAHDQPAAVAKAQPQIAKTGRTTVPARDSGVSADHLRAVWSKTDTTSLQRGLATLRSETLAFRRCDMRLTSEDVAVAHCDEVQDRLAPTRRVAWTIDFRRADAHWVIDGVSSNEGLRAAR